MTTAQKLIDNAVAELKLTRFGYSDPPTGHMAAALTLLAKARKSLDPPKPVYVNPFAATKGLRLRRTDQGVDFQAAKGEPIAAIGKALIDRVSHPGDGTSGWPGGGCVQYKLLDGPHAGERIYVAEQITPTVKAGQTVKAGATIATFLGLEPAIETGYLEKAGNNPCSHDTSGVQTEAGKAFARFLRSLGCPTQQDPGPGSDRSPCA
jgi:murein DD-endopeptidase MepM/ murein hydrolase activator NlpD